MSLKILYAGSPEASATTLKILFENQEKFDFKIVGVLSNPATAKGRHHDLIPTPVSKFAMENQLPVFTPEHLDSQSREQILPLGADLLVCFAYGHIFGPKFMEMFKFGGINLHPSLLPKYRGCTPVPAAIINCDNQTAVTIQTLSKKMDEGDIVAQSIVELNGTETGESLLNYCAEIGGDLLCQVLQNVSKMQDAPKGKPQSGEASYTGIITKEDGKIRWNESAKTIAAKIRAYYPEPGCWCFESLEAGNGSGTNGSNNQPLRILSGTYISADDEKAAPYAAEPAGKVLSFVKSEGIYIKTSDGILCVTQLQRQGKKAMMYKDFMNGARDFIGSVLK